MKSILNFIRKIPYWFLILCLAAFGLAYAVLASDGGMPDGEAIFGMGTFASLALILLKIFLRKPKPKS